MSKSKHSPGPWRWHQKALWSRESRVVTVNSHNRTPRLAQSKGAGFLEEFDYEGPNASLIAAAPELLAALEFLINFYNFHEHDKNDPAIAAVWSALAKAKGENE